MDVISELPEPIIHHILSFMNTPAEDLVPTSNTWFQLTPPADLVRMSVLSKKWFDLTASFPILNFNECYIASRINYFKYVEYTISRFCQQNIIAAAHRFKIYTSLEEPAELDILNRCLELILNKGVMELDIFLPSSSNELDPYRLPNVLLSVSVLKSLTIASCELPSSLMMLDVIRFRSLIQLTLAFISIDDEGIKHLTTSCPLLQELRIITCHGFKRFCVYGHQNLQNVVIDYDHQVVERIDIEAPNLSTLLVRCGGEKGAPKMNLALCQKLTRVSYYGYPSTNSIGFTDFLSNFPFVETMFLATGYKCNNLKFSSHSLRTLVLHSICDLEVIEFNAPNLAVFDYNYIDRVPLPPYNDPTHLKACMRCYLDFDVIDAIWFQKLRLFLDKKSGFKVNNLFIYEARPWATPIQNFIELEKLKAIGLQPYELEHVELQLDTRQESVDHVAFVDALLWCCRPKSLTISFSIGLQPDEPDVRRDFEVPSDFVKFTYEKLLEQEDEGHTNIQIVLPFSTPLMELLPGEKAIAFIKEEGARSHPKGREMLAKQKTDYSDVIVSDLPDKLTLENVAFVCNG